MVTLNDIWETLSDMGCQSDKNSIHSYIPVYETILAPYRHTAVNVLEIGLWHGHSLRMWEWYFTMANVYGIDCSNRPHDGMADLRPMIESGRHRIEIGDATKESDIDRIYGDKKFDVVIDDSSHQIDSQLKIIDIFKSRMVEGGLIVVEDIQDLDKDREKFERLPYDVEVIDLRHKKGRYDDTMAVIKF